MILEPENLGIIFWFCHKLKEGSMEAPPQSLPPYNGENNGIGLC